MELRNTFSHMDKIFDKSNKKYLVFNFADFIVIISFEIYKNILKLFLHPILSRRDSLSTHPVNPSNLSQLTKHTEQTEQFSPFQWRTIFSPFNSTHDNPLFACNLKNESIHSIFSDNFYRTNANK